MLKNAELLTHYQTLYEQQAIAPTWMSDYQRQAWRTLLEKQLPTPKLEAWKYTRLKDYLVKREPIEEVGKINYQAIKSVLFPQISNTIMLSPQGHVFSQTIEQGVSIKTTEQLSLQEQRNWLTWLKDKPYFKEDGLNALNLALVPQCVFIEIAKKTTITSPLQLISCVSGLEDERSYWSNQRVFIKIGEGSQLHLKEVLLGQLNTNTLSNQAMQLSLGEKATLQHTVAMENAQDNYCIHKHQITLAEDSHYDLDLLATGMLLNRQEFNVCLQGKKAHAGLRGVLGGAREEKIDVQVLVQHQAEKTQSTQIFHALLNDKAIGIFNGQVQVQKGTLKVVSQQTNHNLLLCDHAKMNTKPELVIHSEEVQCTHGATVGRLDQQALFYLQTRGLSKQAAQQMLIQAFIKSVLDKMCLAGDQQDKVLLQMTQALNLQ